MFAATNVTAPPKQIDSSSDEDDEEEWPPQTDAYAPQTEFYELQLVREVAETEHIRDRVYFLVKYV